MKPKGYTLQQIRQGTGWPKGARFELIADEDGPLPHLATDDVTEQERQQSRERIIEDMIDGSDTARVLEAVEAVLYDKAQHLREAWQDELTARAYEYVARRVGKAYAAAIDRLDN